MSSVSSDSGISWLSHPKNLFSVEQTDNKNALKQSKKPDETPVTLEENNDELQKIPNGTPKNPEIKEEGRKKRKRRSKKTSTKKCELQENHNEENKYTIDELIQKLKSNTELFEMVDKLANVVEDTRDTGKLKRKLLNNIITTVVTTEDKDEMEFLAIKASEFQVLLWQKTAKGLVVDETQIKTQYLLDTGATGNIYFGTFVKNNTEQKVAIKKPKIFCEGILYREAAIMSQFDHNNIVKLIAISKSKFEIALEYMEFGNLISALKRHNFTDLDLLNVIKDVATGMEYLHSKDFIHSDLACRNILVNAHKQCKIGDFGNCDYVGYTDGENLKEIVPPTAARNCENIAPEVCNFGHFSKASDVWAMGIAVFLMYISSSCETLFMAIQLMKLEEFTAGYNNTLEKPVRCPKDLWKFTIEKMLNRNKTKRASFTLIREKIDIMIQQISSNTS